MFVNRKQIFFSHFHHSSTLPQLVSVACPWIMPRPAGWTPLHKNQYFSCWRSESFTFTIFSFDKKKKKIFLSFDTVLCILNGFYCFCYYYYCYDYYYCYCYFHHYRYNLSLLLMLEYVTAINIITFLLLLLLLVCNCYYYLFAITVITVLLLL